MTTVQAIDARVARYRALIDELTALRAEVCAGLPAVETVGAPSPGNPAPRGATVAPRGLPRPRANEDERRRTIAQALLSGPLNLGPLVERVRMQQNRVSQLLKHPWFAKTGPGLRDPWGLTEAGRAALAVGTAK